MQRIVGDRLNDQRMRIGMITAFALFCLAAPAGAQQAAPSQSPPAAGAPAATPAPGAPAGRKVDRCRGEGLQQKLRGQPLSDFIQVCRLETRLTCLKDAIAKKITGPARRAYINSCET